MKEQNAIEKEIHTKIDAQLTIKKIDKYFVNAARIKFSDNVWSYKNGFIQINMNIPVHSNKDENITKMVDLVVSDLMSFKKEKNILVFNNFKKHSHHRNVFISSHKQKKWCLHNL